MWEYISLRGNLEIVGCVSHYERERNLGKIQFLFTHRLAVLRLPPGDLTAK